MARKLKTFITSVGFFEEAVAAPSMKAAIELLGGDKDLFHKGFAKETDDPAVISAAMEHPGVVIKRPVGSKGAFQLHAKLPAELPRGITSEAHKAKPGRTGRIKKSGRKPNDAGKAAEDYARREKRRQQQRRNEEIAQAKAVERRERRVAKAKQAFEVAERKYEQRLGKLEAQQNAIDQKIEAEKSSWATARKRLEIAIKKAGEL